MGPVKNIGLARVWSWVRPLTRAMETKVEPIQVPSVMRLRVLTMRVRLLALKISPLPRAMNSPSVLTRMGPEGLSSAYRGDSVVPVIFPAGSIES